MADWQSLDPEAAREAEKYENPIPSRELILQHLSERGSPAAREELMAELGLNPEAGALPTHDELVQRHADHVARIAAAAPGLCAAGGAV